MLRADWLEAPNSERAIIQIPGWKGDSLASSRTEAMAAIAVAAGVSCLRLNPIGHGQGETKSDGNLEDFELRVARQGVVDAMDFIEGNFNINRFGLIGSSVGGGVALYTAACDTRVEWLDLLAARWDYRSTKPDLYAPNNVLRASGLDVNWMQVAEKIVVPTLILHGKDDVTVNPSDSARLYEMINLDPSSVELLDCAHHITGPGLDQAIEHTKNWLRYFV